MKKLKSLSLQKLLQYTKPYQKRFNWVVVFAISLSIFAAIRPYMLKITVDEYVQKQDQSGLLLYILLMGLVLVLEVSSQFFFTYWANWLGQDIVKDIREKLFDKIINFRMRYFDNEPVGKLVTRAVSDIESIASIFSQGLFMIVSDLLKMFVVLCIMFYMNWKLSCIVLIAMPILLYATREFQRHMKTAFQEVRTQISNLNTFVQERLTGMKIVQLFTREEIEYEKFKEINHKHNVAWLKNILYNSIFFPIADIVSSLTLGFVIWYGGMSIVQGDNLTSFGDLFAYTMLITMLFNPLRQIADKFNVMQMGIIAAERVFEVLETEEQIDDSGTVTAPQFNGKIELKDVRFSYIEGTEVLKGINLDIAPGSTIAIVGSSGAGKSTIINLLNRFYDIDSGTICIDGVNINDYRLATLRKQVAVVLQDVFLFSDTIYNNITLHDESITRETVIEAAKKIGIHDFILQLPGGYDYNVKERGVMLSSGQRQLIAFLRAYVSNPSILILDEATSSIDTHSEELLQKATDYLTKDRTSIIIAHRLATIVNADQIIVMDKGKIVEKGTHKDLLEIQNGYYKNLHESQFNKQI
ncbi:ABC transporter ATP-binding protein [Myroides odoratimimus]|uniref:ABC transporter ATP-binding protein n=1 Tax=Myroides odoratimimus TaxID=76832 RepID=UPI000354701A|nr:ABC transporter ATP-binding protein [Myroides odoratimimus]EPH11521.1 ATP-binding cassette, subfamily B, bacterial MsbA [Myroides odoratimimus CCUG 12700]MCO7723847.1 ABC transporter ATP-binding protein/permease [Myroides odoratimimus]MDM1499811.1 ABC transporter ATP-binding protein [Myroides odoratimimus]MDM1507185.1 ABC transporter ATP-binding protein [Myroides odoratimimus]MDM1513894.1 ABC transporter ATP-binding protein [Myroides odoratimimus]